LDVIWSDGATTKILVSKSQALLAIRRGDLSVKEA